MKETANDWDPDLYLKYNKERILPSIDLISKIRKYNPRLIIDIGCGPGNSTQILRQRWPESKIVGIDNSKSMIEKAKNDYPDMDWKLIDAGTDEIPGKYDIVFSNATIQWIPDHVSLFVKLQKLLNEQGIIAVQIPLFFEMKIGQIINKVAENNRWSSFTGSVKSLFTIHTFSEYYDKVSPLFASVEMHLTDYIHVMNSHASILEMVRGAGLKPYLERFSKENEKMEFENEVLKGICNNYPEQKDGKVLFPFKRLFIILQ